MPESDGHGAQESTRGPGSLRASPPLSPLPVPPCGQFWQGAVFNRIDSVCIAISLLSAGAERALGFSIHSLDDRAYPTAKVFIALRLLRSIRLLRGIASILISSARLLVPMTRFGGAPACPNGWCHTIASMRVPTHFHTHIYACTHTHTYAHPHTYAHSHAYTHSRTTTCARTHIPAPSPAVVLLSAFYAFAIVGNDTFAHQLTPSNPAVAASAYGVDNYYALNFNSLPRATVSLYYLLVVNNWPVLADGCEAAVGKWSRLYFLAWYLVAVTVILNVFVAFLIDVYLLAAAAQRRYYRGELEPWERSMRDAMNQVARGPSPTAAPPFPPSHGPHHSPLSLQSSPNPAARRHGSM